MRNSLIQRFISMSVFFNCRFWVVATILITSVACSFPGMIARSDKSEQLSTRPDLPARGEYYGDMNPSEPGGWIYQGNCRMSEGIRLWMDRREFIYTFSSVCGSTKDSGIETWMSKSTGTDNDQFGQIFPKGMIYSTIRTITWKVGKGISENKQITTKGLVGKISSDLNKIEYCTVQDQGMAYDEESLFYTFETVCGDDPSTIEINRIK